LITVSLLGHLLSLGKEMLVASRFGIIKEMDAFYAAAAVPTLLISIINSTIGAIFIPVFVRYRQNNSTESEHIFSVFASGLLLLLLLVSLPLYLFAPAVVTFFFHGFSSATTATAAVILRIMTVGIVLSGLVGIISNMLNTYEYFAAPALSQIAVTVVTVAFLLLLYPRYGVFVLAYGFVAGLALQLAVLGLFAWKRGFRYRPVISITHPAIREMLSLGSILLVAVVASQLNMLVDRVMASYLPAGSIAALGYADKLVQVPLIIFTGSMITALFPYLSSQAAGKRAGEMAESIGKSVRTAAFILIPLTVLLVLLARPIISLLFERGAFDEKASYLTSVVFICYAFQFFFTTLTAIFGRVLLALQEMMVFLKITLTTIGVNVALNFILMRVIDPPVAGIALSTSLVMLMTTFLYGAAFNRKGIAPDWRSIRRSIKKIVLVSAAMAIVVVGVKALCNGTAAMPSMFARSLQVLLPGVAGVLTFVSLSKIIKLDEASKFGALFKMFGNEG
jgi:putative peptidoglycan lipid II flippase